MKKSNNKGFTLVELIVVLVILAILAAILVPALLGYIDKAKEGQYAEEGHAILVAAQGYETEQYAKKNSTPVANFTGDTKALKYVNDIVSPTKVKTLTVILGTSTTDIHDQYTIKELTVEFTSQDGKFGKMTFDGSTWIVDTPFTEQKQNEDGESSGDGD